MIPDIAKHQHDPQHVRPAHLVDPTVDVLWVQAVVAEGEEDDGRGGSDLVVRDDVGVFPRDVVDELQDRVAFLCVDTRRSQHTLSRD